MPSESDDYEDDVPIQPSEEKVQEYTNNKVSTIDDFNVINKIGKLSV